MWTLTNATNAAVTMDDSTLGRAASTVVFALTPAILKTVSSGDVISNPPIALVSPNLVDESGGEVSDTVEEITEAANEGSADTAPTANAIATLTSAVNDLKKAVVAAL